VIPAIAGLITKRGESLLDYNGAANVRFESAAVSQDCISRTAAFIESGHSIPQNRPDLKGCLQPSAAFQLYSRVKADNNTGYQTAPQRSIFLVPSDNPGLSTQGFSL